MCLGAQQIYCICTSCINTFATIFRERILQSCLLMNIQNMSIVNATQATMLIRQTWWISAYPLTSWHCMNINEVIFSFINSLYLILIPCVHNGVILMHYTRTNNITGWVEKILLFPSSCHIGIHIIYRTNGPSKFASLHDLAIKELCNCPQWRTSQWW